MGDKFDKIAERLDNQTDNQGSRKILEAIKLVTTSLVLGASFSIVLF